MLPSPLAILAAVVTVFLVVLVVARGTVDADYWWHLTTGRLILESGAVPTTDPFSFGYDGGWVAHEWLGEVFIAGLVDTLGVAVTAFLFGMAAAASLLLVAFAMRRQGVATPPLGVLLVIGSYVLASFATIRPQVISWLLLGLLLSLLVGLRPEHRIRPWLVVPLFWVWANLHGLWVVGAGVLTVYVAFTLLGRTRFAPRRLSAAGMLVGAALATAFTPAGVENLAYPLRYLRTDDWGTAFIAEWQSPDFLDPRNWGLVLLIMLTVLFGRGRAPGWLTLVAVTGLVMALIAVRNAPLASLMTMPMLALAIDGWLSRRRQRDEERPPRSEQARRQRRLMELGAAGIVIAGILAIVPPTVGGPSVLERSFPVAAMDELVAADPSARALVDYDWGGYAIHRLHGHGGQVFIDGRSDMYPREVFEAYRSMHGAAEGWEELARDAGVEAILLRPDAPLVSGPAQAAGWCEAHRDEVAVLLLPC